MDSDNQQPVYVVPGATGGIGSVLCRLSETGAKLVLGARDEKKLKKLAGERDAHPVSPAIRLVRLVTGQTFGVERLGQYDEQP